MKDDGNELRFDFGRVDYVFDFASPASPVDDLTRASKLSRSDRWLTEWDEFK